MLALICHCQPLLPLIGLIDHFRPSKRSPPLARGGGGGGLGTAARERRRQMSHERPSHSYGPLARSAWPQRDTRNHLISAARTHHCPLHGPKLQSSPVANEG